MTGVSPVEIAADGAGDHGTAAPAPGGEPVLVTVAEYAELRGIRRQNVYKALKRYGIAKVGGRFDMAALDRARDQQGDPARQMVAADQQARDATAREPEVSTFQAMRARREEADAKYAELKLERARGELIDRRQVTEALVTAGRRIRERLDAVPALAEELLALAKDGDVGQLRAFLRAEVRKLETTIVENLQLGDEDG